MSTKSARVLQMPPKSAAQKKSGSGVTIHDVAKLAGVSIITVSRALNSPGRLAPDTLKRVENAIAQTRYVPNLMAGGLRSAKSRLVVALVPALAGQQFVGAIEALTRALEANGYQLMLGQAGYAKSREDRLLDAIIGRRPDGIVLTGIMHSPEGRHRLMASGIPVVETWDYTPTPIDMLVGFSHERVGQEVCDYLVKRGRKRFAVVSGDDDRARQRQKSFERAALRHGLAAPQVELVPAPATHASGRKAFANVLARDPKVDAVFCSSDTLAMAVMTEARVRGVSIPGELGVVGFGDLEFAATLSPSLTSVRIDGSRLGEIAAKFIVDRASGQAVAQPVVDIGFTVIERESA